MYRVLFVDDDKDILLVNKNMLERQGKFEVYTAMNLAEAQQKISKQAPDIIILDIMLPDGSGLDLLFKLRQNTDIPVLLLTALGESSDVVQGLKAGGDDYLAKPYDNGVLLARIESLLRRTARIPKTLTKGLLTLDIIAGRAFLNNKGTNCDLLLTQKEFAILLLLAQDEGAIKSAQSIYESVWKQPLDGNISTLQVTISNLRKKIEPSWYTITVSRGHGYVFERI